LYIAPILALAFSINAIITTWHTNSQRHHIASLVLADLRGTVIERANLDSLVANRLDLPAHTRDRLGANSAALEEQLAQLRAASPTSEAAVRTEAQRHAQAEARLLELVSAGRTFDARTELTESPLTVEPLLAAVEQARESEHQAIKVTEQSASVTTGLLIALIVTLAALLYWRLHRARSRARQLEGTEHSLRESERRLSSLVRNATDVIFIVKPDGVIKYRSPAAGLMWGWRPETLLGWDYLKIVHPDDHGRARELMGQTIQRPQVNVGAELRFQAASGAWRDAEVLAINLLEDSAVEGVVLTCRDITYRKRAEDKIRSMNTDLEQRVVERTAQLQVAVTDLEAEVRERRRVEEERSVLLQEVDRERSTLLGVTASMTDGLLVVAPSGEIRFCNEQAGMLLDVDAQRVAGQDLQYVWWTRRNSFEDPERAWEALDQALAGEENAQRFELALTGPVPRDIVFDFFPLDPVVSGDARMGIILRDVTAERSLDRTKDELISVVSHELRTPLTSLVGFAELLLKRDLSDEQRKQFVGVMLDEGKRLTTLLNDFLDLQRIESGRQQINQMPLHLSSIVERAAATISGADHPITVDLPDTLPAVHGDPDRLQQVLSNLLSNAKKYSPDGGEIVIRGRAVDAMVEVSIADRGLGIPAEALPHLFQKFYRIDNSDRRSIKGTGLGLAICRRIVEEHGGEIWAESPGLGRGSTIYFTLLRAAEPLPDSAFPEPSVAQQNRESLVHAGSR
jgi:PAS domain S-box-containing protein